MRFFSWLMGALVWSEVALIGCEQSAPIAKCDSPNPADEECTRDEECGEGLRCLVAANECRSSACGCGEAGWECNDDCNPRHRCLAPASCTTPNPSASQCESDRQCPTGKVCNLQGCAPSGCSCDNGQWLCTEDCRPSCTPPPTCGVDPSKDGCTSDNDCPGSERCVPTGSDGCRPSSCVCEEGATEWGCSKDCLEYHACTP